MFAFSVGPPANRVPLQELVYYRQYKLIDDQLNSEIEVTDFPCLAENFDGVAIYSNAMGLPQNQHDEVFAFLEDAQSLCSNLYKALDLLELLLKLRKERIADKICQHLITQCEYIYTIMHAACTRM